ncbi:UNVERIFIED_CONTAM: hypothetical protein Slati_2494000 [Sesamum latifolium]|uniref:Retrotransposon protein n=1 Tax=Sesamum latifolium TaxID=2727402 RepID=A0AAW2WE93_9LAMI
MPREGHFDPPTPGRTGWCSRGSPAVHFVIRIGDGPNPGFLVWAMHNLVVGLGLAPPRTSLGRAGGNLWASFYEGLSCYRKWAGLEFSGLHTLFSPPHSKEESLRFFLRVEPCTLRRRGTSFRQEGNPLGEKITEGFMTEEARDDELRCSCPSRAMTVLRIIPSLIVGGGYFWDRSRRMLGLIQSSYIEKVLKRFKMEHSKREVLPMRQGIKLSKKQSPKTDEELKRMSNIPYASAVGSIQYVVQCTRPDVAYALSVTSRYQACAGEAHWGAVKSILKYLKRTKDMFLIYGGGELILEGYSDASFQSDDDDDANPNRVFYSSLMVVWSLGRVPSRIPQRFHTKLNTSHFGSCQGGGLDEKLHPRVGCGT